jgi:EAL domain-containing protein (putative c-di-GMP-specific phosphodiesterase class I)
MRGDLVNSAETAPASRARILIADDESAVLRALAQGLEGAGFLVTTANDGARAMRYLAEASFDVVLTDVRMPGMSGLELLRAVRERDLEVPVLLMTGAPDVESAAEAVHHGASEYLLKPIPLEHLERTIRRAVGMSGLARAKRESLRLLDTGRPEAGDRTGLEVTLDRALQTMWMAYQPIVEARTRALFAYEALLRSTEPAMPHPGAVLEAAEVLGRLHDVGRTVRSRVLDQVPKVPPACLLFVNLHASDLSDDALSSPSAPFTTVAQRVVLEVTERNSLDGIRDLRHRMARLRGLGFRIAVDDLGAGYAGLTSFAQLEPEFVKLDMSLVRDVHKNAIKRKLVHSMTGLCKDMGIAVVAEGIEVAEERDTVIELGCDLLQGNLLAKPGRPFPQVSW